MRNKISGKAPLRISFAGGGTDLDYIFEKHGSNIVNVTINKFCHMQINKRKDKKVFVNNIELTETNNPLVWDTIHFLKFKGGLDIFFYNDILPGTGLGNSSSFVSILVALISELRNIKYDDRELVDIVYKIENKRTLTGWQDQFAIVMGGFNYMEFTKKDKIVYPLRVKYRTLCELQEHLLLCYVGNRKSSGDIQLKQKERYCDNEESILKILTTQTLAIKIKNCLLTDNIQPIGTLLNEAWKLKRNSLVTNARIDKFYETGILNGAIGGKLTGAGQAGFILFFVNPENRTKLINALEKIGGKIEDFNFTVHGVETW